MAQANITTTEAAAFVPEIWANEALDILRSNIVMAPLVTKDTDLAAAQVGDTLHIPFVDTLKANDKKANTPVTLQTATATDTTVKLDKHKEATILVEDFARTVAQPVLMNSYQRAQIVALAEAVETDLIGTYSAFSGSVGTAGTDLDAATLRAVNKKFTDNKAPRGNRHLLISTKDSAALQADASLQNFFAFNEGARGDISNGLIASNIYGLQLHESQLVPEVAGAAEGDPATTNNFAFDPGAVILASRPLAAAPVGTGVAQAAVTDPASGIVLRVSMSYNPDQLGVQITYDVLYGVAKLRDALGFAVLA
ncbi:MAG: hypothetical protein LKJ05_02785 [Bifidobacteriaceae bacterium]|jgi:hypothetical protein|nr:hypothetical protein [Bifidobacteriaceae bacterium]